MPIELFIQPSFVMDAAAFCELNGHSVATLEGCLAYFQAKQELFKLETPEQLQAAAETLFSVTATLSRPETKLALTALV